MPEVEADNVVALLTMPQGTSKEQTEKIIKKIEESAVFLNDELNNEGKGPIQHILASVGDQPFLSRQFGAAGYGGVASSSHLGEVNLQLVSAEIREITSIAIAQRWRELTGTIPEAEELVFSASLFSAGDPVNIQLSGANYEELLMASNELQQEISTYSGVFDIADSYREGKSEIKLKVKPEVEALGLSLSLLARQVCQAFYGEEVQRIQRGRDDIRVMVRYPQEQRRSMADLENMRIRIPGVGEVPFNVAAEVVQGTGFASINRTNRNRTVNITADVDLSTENQNEIVSDIVRNVLPELLIAISSYGHESDNYFRIRNSGINQSGSERQPGISRFH